MRELYVEELSFISAVVEEVQRLEKVLTEDKYIKDCTVKLPESFDFQILDINDEPIGHVGYGPQGIICFMPKKDKDD